MSDDNEIHYEAHQKINEILLELQELEADGRAEWKSFIPKLTELKDSRQSHTNMIGTQMDKLNELKEDVIAMWKFWHVLSENQVQEKEVLRELLAEIFIFTYPDDPEERKKVEVQKYRELLEKLDGVGSARQTEAKQVEGLLNDMGCNVGVASIEWGDYKPPAAGKITIKETETYEDLPQEEKMRRWKIFQKRAKEGDPELNTVILASGGEKEKVSEGTLVKDRTTLKDAGYDQTDSKLPEPVKVCTTCGHNTENLESCDTCNTLYINWIPIKPREDDKENMVFATFDKRTYVVVKRENLQNWVDELKNKYSKSHVIEEIEKCLKGERLSDATDGGVRD